MSRKFYTFAILGFIFIPALLSLVMLLPILCPQYSYIYYLLRPYGVQIFADKQSLWGFVGVLSAAVGILIGFIYKECRDTQEFAQAIGALYHELLRNIDLLFTGEVERPSLFEAFERVSREYANKIGDAEKYRMLRQIYDELYYYREILRAHWLSIRSFRVDLERMGAGLLVTQKQFGACNLIVEFFDGQKIDPNLNPRQHPLSNYSGNNRWEKLRAMAIETKEENYTVWERKLKQELELIFKVKLK